MATPLLRLYLAISLDGFIATSDGKVDWLDDYPAEQFGFDVFLATIETIIMGRTSYEQALSFGAWPFAPKRTIVMTSRPLAATQPGVERRQGDVSVIATELRTESANDVWLFGGANLARQFLDRGLVDRVELFVIPVLLGSGIRLFETSGRRIPLQLDELKQHAKGVVQVAYSPKRQR
jgi:dihydrofolate reductase